MTARAVVLLVAAAACGGTKKQAPRPQEPQMDPEPEVTAPTEQLAEPLPPGLDPLEGRRPRSSGR